MLFLLMTMIISLSFAKPELPSAVHCSGKPEKGPCNRNIFKWAFDHQNRECVTFIWGGCGGNDKNRFESESQCIERCFSSSGDNLTLDDIMSSIPKEKRGPKLTFQETGTENTFMFAQSNTFIQIDGDIIQTFQLRLCRQISFQFRTKLPHGLLVYHNVKVPKGIQLQPYALYIIVQQGQLKVVHVYGKHSTALTVGRGLNNDQWHTVTVRIDVHAAKLLAIVDDLRDETDLRGLDTENNYGVAANVTSVILIGGLSSEERLHGVKYIIESFVGCIKDVVLSTGKSASDLLQISPLIATKHENVQEGCIDKCLTNENLCFKGSRCVNHYYAITCDCFGTNYEGEFCDFYTATVLTLRGSSYVSYRVYDWKDRIHSSVTRFSIMFKTRFDDSALLYAAGGEHGIDHYIAASIYNRSVYIVMDFGENNPVTIRLGNTPDFKLKEWNNLTIFHEHEKVHLILNDEIKTINITGKPLLYIDPEIYIGGGPELQKKIGLKSSNNFVGSLKYVFYNDISIIYELHKNNPKVHYLGLLRPEFYEADVNIIPITFPFSASHIWWHNDHVDSLSLSFHFKASSNLSVIASSEAQTGLYWEVRVVNDEVRFELLNSIKNTTHLISVKKTPGIWHFLNVTYSNDEITVSVDKKGKTEKISDLKFAIGDKIKVAAGSRSNAGLVGCMRDIEVNGVVLEPRSVLQTERVVGEVTLDDCRFVDACLRPNTCEHGGKCSVKEDRLICDCTNTGYTGTNCHFALYRKTCEELALLGYTKPDVYLIDIDGNGRFPPAHVRCEFQSIEESTKTIVEHNLPSQMDVRSPSEKDFSFNIKYREFNAEMLQELVSHSLNCSQYIKYDCLKAPLELHSASWFISSANETVDYIGDVKRGTCPCSIGRKCENPAQWCNCDDVNDDKWNTDDGYYTTANTLGITEMVFLQQPDLPEDALGRITLGPLECVETNTQRYVVTFTTSQSYIEVPGWRKGDLAFSFRTTGKKAILLYQPPIRPNYPSFMVALTSDFQLTFNFTLNTGVSKELVIVSGRRLNGGEWHKLWIDYNKYHVRFMINEDYQMVDLKPEEEFGPFEGSMFIGGAPNDLLDPKSSVQQGLIGCFRGLVVNEEILDIYSYMSVHLSEIIKDCKPSCVPNPCKNGAQCKELWSRFECICPNPWAYTGEYCEININTNAVTFTHSESYLHKNYFTNDTGDEKNILKDIFKKRILLNLRTYDNNSLIFYANDHLNNFVHLHIIEGTKIEYLFNHENQIHNITVPYKYLNTSKSVQIAIIREENITTVFVNDQNNSIPIGVKLLDTYSNKPWNNSEKEVLAPQRPPAPPTEYFQLNIGGYDPETLLKVADYPLILPGYVGCFRGFQIGNILIDLPPKINTSKKGVTANCNMKCDELPCKHGGICIEDFGNQENTCNCEHTSYYGEFCNEEKGADFNGEAILSRVYVLNGTVDYVKIQLAFSSLDVRQKNTVLLLLQTENNRSYYLLVGLSLEGYLIIQEDREGAVFSATVNKKSFINGARHSIYYKREFNESELYVDRELTDMVQIPAQTFTNIPELGANEVQIGGQETNDPRFAIYKKFSGCLSNIFIEVNKHVMKPLEEYMLFTKAGSEKVNVSNSHGVRSAQCSADFDVVHEKAPGIPNLNISQGKDKTWVQDAPQRILYTSIYSADSVEEDNIEQIIVIALASFFVLILICICYDVYRTDKKYKERKEFETDASILLSKQQAAIKLQDSNKATSDEERKNSLKLQQNGKVQNEKVNGDAVNGKTVEENGPVPEEVPQKSKSNDRKDRQKRISFRDSASELTWDNPDETSDMLSPMMEEEEDEQEENNDIDDHDQAILKDADSSLYPVETTNNETEPLISSTDTNGDTNSELASFSSDNIPGIYRPSKIVTNTKPLLVGEHTRKFDNPISYLGGPKLPLRNRWSVESVVSID
ncbi:contactin-associated protein-like 5 isoform X2 [Sitophilus oryzae]|uniref:Contactin-associated protein-like 5 isoform X2 n=1 Tax=Sitophilus oryzae TaxID=7048 RepID=A0A6J2X4K8_SITOR|nr:contactin-associated protein-like 5 isoform X2 [Sitophilus oryzae]